MDIVGDIARHYIHIPIVMGGILLYGFLLYLVFFKPVRRVLDQRRENIEGSAALAVKAREESREKLEIYEAKLSEARKEAGKAREKVRQEVIFYQAELLDTVKKEIETKNASRDKEFEMSLERAEKQLRSVVPELAAKMAEKVLQNGASA